MKICNIMNSFKISNVGVILQCPYGPYYIWGATARIIKSFVEKYQS